MEVGVARAHGDDVVGIVPHRGGQGAALQAHPLQKPATDVPGAPVAFHHDQLQQITLEVGYHVSILDAGFDLACFGHDLPRDDADDGVMPAPGRDR